MPESGEAGGQARDASEETQINGESLPTADPNLALLAARYTVLAELGRGGMGIVYKVRDRETDEIIALKLLQPEIASRPDLIERFKAELRLARKITHKNVCRVYDLSRFGKLAAISMEYVEGQSLRHLLQRVEGLSVPHGLKIVRQIFNGLAEAHAQGVVHRDLKPENILIARDGTVKVMDFGVARLAGAGATLTGGMTGTPAYMSPEQASGKEADARSDIYSLGLVVYEMFTGQPAFRADTPIALALKQIQETPPPPREVNPYLPEFLDRAVRKCLEKDPAKRFQSVEELEPALSPVAEIEPAAQAAPETEPLLLTSDVVRWLPRDSWLLGGGLLAAIVFLALFSRVYPYASLRIHISPEEAVEKAVALVRKFEPAAASGRAEPYWRWWLGERGERLSAIVPMPEIQQAIALILRYSTARRWWLDEYPVKVSVLGLSEANRQLVYDEYWEVRVSLGPDRGPARVGLRTDGSLCDLHLPPRAGSEALPPPSSEQATRDGIAYVRQLFATDVSNLESKLQHASQATGISWELPGPMPDLKRIISVRLGHDGLMGIWEAFHSRHESEMRSAWGGPVAAQDLLRLRVRRLGVLVLPPLALLMLVLFFARRLYQKAGRSAVLAAFCFTLAIGGLWLQDHSGEQEFAWLSLPAGAVAWFLVAFFLLATAEDYLWKRLRSRAVTWFLLVRRPGEARAAGLSILRGCALGFIYLSAHTLIMYALGWARLAGPSTLWMEVAALSGRPYLALYALSFAVRVTIDAAWILVGFPAALASGITRRPFALVAVPAALWAIMASNLPGTTPSVVWVVLLFAALQGVVFSLIFYRYDLLALASAVFTVETWLLVYPVWTIFSVIQPLQSLAMLPWFALIVAAAAIYLRPQLQGARRQLAAILE